MTQLEQLIQRFADNEDRYKSFGYNETQVRREFIDPLFSLLGWDVENKLGYAEQYKDVIHEDAIKVAGTTKAPDYSFRIGGQRKFFVEAKKPSVDIRGDIHPAYQLRRYAWSAKLPLSILTDFEEFAVYDCRIKPLKNDKSSTARVMYYTYKDYLDKWDEISSIFSRDAILKGSFDRYAESSKKKRGTAEVDDAFLSEMESWRELLARNFALRNKELSTRALNEVVQRTIDRIVFLRICEDRGIEKYGQLQTLVNVNDVYSHLRQIFLQADQKYNSGLFHFQKESGREEYDNWTLELNVDDKALKEILKRLYYPESPYEFSVLPTSILGQVYERFLGKVIRLTAGHQAKIEEKPEVRKAGGVFYTPTYIVDYIVSNTVGKLLGAEVKGIGNEELGIGEEGRQNTSINKGDRFNENGESEKLQRAGSLERSSRINSDDLQNDKDIPKGGTLRSDKSNPEGSSINSSEHSGGLGQDVVKRTEALHPDSKRISNGSRDAYHNSSETGIHNQRRSNPDLEAVGDSKQTSQRYSSITKQNKFIANSKFPTPNSPVSIEQAKQLKIVDPACGSGSFLLGAFQYLLDWYLEQYTKKPEKYLKGKNPKIYELKDNEYRLTTNEKKRILLDNIYGVDIDSQAVEVTKLSLLLKVLEDETEESLGLSRQFQMKFAERALPDLSNNIKCGNSLIGSDFYEGRDMSLFGEEDHLRINVFDWDEEFPEVFGSERKGNRNLEVESGKSNSQLPIPNSQKGGFDAVIGNPPYVRQESLKEFKEYFKSKYEVYHGTADLYVYFIEKSIKLLNPNGYFSFIVANKWFRANYGKPLRKWLKDQNINEIIDFGDLSVFQGATTYPAIIRFSKGTAQDKFRVTNVLDLKFNSLTEYVEDNYFEYEKKFLDDNGWNLVDSKIIELIKKIKSNNVSLEEYTNTKIFRGLLTGLNKAFVIDEETRNNLIQNDPKSAEIIKPFLAGKEIKRYAPLKPKDYLIFFPKGWTNNHYNGKDSWSFIKNQYPFIAEYLSQFKEEAMRRYDQGDYWWELRACDYYKEFEFPKIMLPDISLRGNFSLDEEGAKYCVNTAYIIGSNEKYLLGILNSKLITFIYQSMSSTYRGGYLRFIYQYLTQLPIRTIDFDNPDDVAKHDKMVQLVESMLELNKKVHADGISTQEKKMLQKQIDITDKQIDQLVYQLYDLTEEEIKVVEGGVSEHYLTYLL